MPTTGFASEIWGLETGDGVKEACIAKREDAAVRSPEPIAFPRSRRALCQRPASQSEIGGLIPRIEPKNAASPAGQGDAPVKVM